MAGNYNTAYTRLCKMLCNVLNEMSKTSQNNIERVAAASRDPELYKIGENDHNA